MPKHAYAGPQRCVCMHKCEHNGIMVSPPGFCNSLITIYIATFRGRTTILTTRDMSSEFRYVLRKLLGTQDRPTLRLASHHYLLCLNSHTYTSIHLSIQHDIIHPKTYTYPSIQHKEPNHTYTTLMMASRHSSHYKP